MKQFDALIIGFGKAGKTLAGFLAKQGKTVALIEKSPQMYGGTCINVGCIPSKSLVNSSADSQLSSAGNRQKQEQNYAAAIAEKNRVTTLLRQKNYDKLASAGVKIIDGTASFVDDNTIAVEHNGQTENYTAPQIFINTGAASFIPPLKGIDGPRIFTSETLMNLPQLPQHLVIIGGGYIGLEFASIYAGFGSKITILQDLKDFLPRDDRDIAESILSTLKNKGIEFNFGVKVEEFEDNGNSVQIQYNDANGKPQSIEADAVLVATGRRPDVKGLNLENAHINLTKFGAVEVNPQTLQTSNPKVWAMGDVTGGLQFTYVSLDDFRVIKSQLFGDKSYTADQRQNVPYSVFFTPPYSRVGLSETEARAKGYNLKIGKLPVAAIPKSQVLKSTDGLLKVVINADNNQILGAMLFCPESHEMINLIKFAMDHNIPYTALRDEVYTHPTMTEAFNDLFAI